ncbi:response regulator transcription factor [Pedobacter frigiditerrae]|uniref:Response regulator transcription factor n=1 Tax=Pedobacter frigiditerrae TaxID=2530452 RepID=A0A4R0N0K3_9SPHI|nr:LytTR family DNA-binding domain-containing protein [Pedobacter frigiditerrae]TCC93231.1 response regulator transcription factor [Pedobacter frigiditerrae]
MDCLIIDDNQISRLTLIQLIALDPSLNLIAECASAKEGLNKILTTSVDLLLLDIEMPGMNGIELAKSLGQKQPMIIFTTSKRDYAVDAFDLKVVDFITKPISPSRFLQSIEKAKEVFQQKNEKLNQQADDFLFIRDSITVRRINVNEILFLEAMGDYVKIQVKDKFYQIHSSLRSVEDKLPKHIFLRVHRSFIINVSKIDTIEGGTLIINGNFVPVSDSFRASLNKRVQIL